MRCPRCEKDNPSDARYCRACGAQVGIACSGCLQLNLPDSRFCGACGKPLAPALHDPKFSSPTAYTPRHLAGRILALRPILEGERKHVSILFADLKGSMELLADRDPEDARQVLDPVLERLMEAVHYYEGTVNQVMGDGIMALFGAPIAHEDHAVRACYAGLRMQASIERYAAELRSTRGLDVQIRVGLNSGEVVVRSISNDLHMDYSAIGQSTHLAARLEQLARPGSILASLHTVRLAEGFVEHRLVGRVPIKGLAEPVEIFELTGIGPAQSRFQAALSRGLTPFVGRERELDELGRALERAADGQGQVVGIVGEAGVGKSRLVWEFLRSLAGAAGAVLQGRSVPHSRTTPYAPLVGVLKGYFGIPDEGDKEAIRRRVLALLTPEESVRFLQPVLALLDVPADDPRWKSLDPDQRRRRILDAVKYLLARRERTETVVVVIEDLHWSDTESRSVLDGLVESLPTARVLLVVSYRPEHEHGWGSRTYYRQIRIDPLPVEGSKEFLRNLLGTAAALERVKSLLIDRTEGNPLFLEEGVRNLVETGVLDGHRQEYRVLKEPTGSELPETVQAVLAARMDRLDLADKRALQAAAVIGKDVPLRLLQAVVEAPPSALGESLRRLEAGEFLYETRFLPDVEYTFRHSLTLEVAFGSLLRERRVALDRRIVEAIERDYPVSSSERLERLAHHALRGELWGKALEYCREAGARAFEGSAHRAAVSHFEGALVALAHLPEDAQALESAIDVRLDLRYALSPLGEYKKMLARLLEAEALAERIGDQRRLGLVSAFLCNFFTLRGEFSKATEYGQRAASVASSVDDVQLRALTNAFLGLAYFGIGEYRRAVEIARENIDLLAGPRRLERFGMALLPSVYLRTVLLWSLAELGEFEDGVSVGDTAMRIAEEAGHPHSLVFACMGLGLFHLRRGEIERAIGVLERGRGICESADLPAVSVELAGALGSAYAQGGLPEKAIAVLEQGIAQAVALRRLYGHWLRTGGLAEAYLHAGRIEEAYPLAQAFLEITRAVRARGSEAWASYLLGR
ncbi:MAG TPA: AAA family ATPase, partial [Methylomirabilota bacterium]|nr:AAA family ATPase [Methylomirabilota bacterium]